MPSLPFDIPDLEAAAASLLRQVPAGRVTTFGRLADGLGETQAARWLAGDWVAICARHHLPGHRVVLRDGRLPAFGGLDPQVQARILREEGVPVVEGRVPLPEAGESLIAELAIPQPRPLDRLRSHQNRVLKQVRLTNPRRWPKLVGGLDVSYASPQEGIAGYALVEVATGRLVDSLTHRAPVRFPYVPGFLAYREVPLYLELLAEVRRRGLQADVLLVDGNGRLHPRLAGVATQLGVVADMATIGVSKSLLCGRIVAEEQLPQPGGRIKTRKKSAKSERTAPETVPVRSVVWEDQVVAQALWSGRSGAVGKPIFVSAGHRVTLDWSIELVLQLLHGHKLPEPTHWADVLSRKAARGGDI